MARLIGIARREKKRAPMGTLDTADISAIGDTVELLK
jgi:hypothetical protein